METSNIPVKDNGAQANAFSKNSHYARFTDEDLDTISQYAFDMGYLLEPEILATDPEHPTRFKIISKTNPAVYGWISKVIEKIDDQLHDTFIYGFYKHGSFRNKYPITFNIQSHLMRGVIKRRTERNPRQETYYRTIFGILDLEPQINPINFIFSWLSACKFSKPLTT